MRKLLIFVLVIFIWSCAPAPKKTQEPVKNAQYYYKIGLSYLNSGNNSQAIYYLTKAYEIEPKNPDILNALGVAYSSVKEFKKAEDFFLKAIEISPDRGEIYTNLGVILAEEKKYNKAIWYFKKAIENPEYKNKEKAFYNLALVYKKLDEDDKYEEYLKKALSYNQYFINAYLALGNYYLSKGMYEDALNVFMKAYNVGIYTPEVYLGLGKSYYHLGKLPKAKYYFLKAKKFAGDNYFVANEADKFISQINEEIARQKEEELKRKQAELEKLEKIKQIEEIAEEGNLEDVVVVKPVERKEKQDLFEKIEKEKEKIEKQILPSEEKPRENVKEPEENVIETKLRFYVQVGVYSNKKYAEEMIKKLKEINLSPRLIKRNVDGKPFYFVIIGYFNSYLEASKFYRKNLKPNGFKGIVKFEKVKG